MNDLHDVSRAIGRLEEGSARARDQHAVLEATMERVREDVGEIKARMASTDQKMDSVLAGQSQLNRLVSKHETAYQRAIGASRVLNFIRQMVPAGVVYGLLELGQRVGSALFR
jgi:hypothetical protein